MPNLIDSISYLSDITNGIRVLLNPIYPVFTKLEKQLINEVRNFISEEYIHIFDEHIKRINYVQRDGGSRLVRMYQWMPLGKYCWERENFFNPKEGINRLIRFSMIFESENITCHGYFVAIDGVLCNISFGEDVVFYENRDDFKVNVRSGSIVRRAVGRNL